MNTSQLVEWQRIDPDNGLVEPWLTHPFMDYIKDVWNLSEVTILETGGGRSTAWWRHKALWVDTIEANKEWGKQIEADCAERNLNNGRLFCADVADGTADGVIEYFKLFPNDKTYDIIVVDGIYRYEVLVWALEHFKGRGGVIVADNWNQDYVWISPPAEELMKKYQINRFAQPNHTNHQGRPWNTVYWIIPQ